MAALNQLLSAFLAVVFLLISPPALACDGGDRAALLKIKASFLSPSSFFSSWNESASCCTWQGVYCTFNSNRVNAISFYNNGGPADGLVGRLPDALGHLPFLSTLLIANHPGVYGRLPSTLTRLRSLSILSLSRNSLSGAIPSFLSQIPSLTLLDLANNKFSGCIPPELSSLLILQSLILENNRLEGGVPASFGNFSKSSPPNLFLAHNKLSGDIPAELGVPDSVNLDLSH
ncbi:Polygalacturonase inhibitor [Platanthera zijinensis]|uniref:Polygalacturonase inhibitor n=1 Tax=Platanthera zijinensis TaxID=2320716 RepID=A0AAP0FW53_9ASPA